MILTAYFLSVCFTVVVIVGDYFMNREFYESPSNDVFYSVVVLPFIPGVNLFYAYMLIVD